MPVRNFEADVRHGLRRLGTSPGFTAIAVLTLALGIGSSTTIFAVMNSLFLPSLPYPHPDQLVVLEHAPAIVVSPQTSSTDFLNWAPQAHSFQSLAAYVSASLSANLNGGSQPEHIELAYVSPNFFRTLGVPVLFGPGFLEGVREKTALNGAILSYGLWRREFRANQEVVGHVITLDGLPYTVVGVAPRQFSFPSKSEAWVTFALKGDSKPGTVRFIGATVLGRLVNGVRLTQAQAEMSAFSEGLRELSGRPLPPIEVTRLAGFDATPVKDTLLILFGAAGLILLVACVNVANLTLSRMANRERELAVRVALGAGTIRLLRPLVMESVLVALLGGLGGFLLAFWGVVAVKQLGETVLPNVTTIHLDGRVLAFALALSLLTGIASGLPSALRALRTVPQEALQGGGGPQTAAPRQTAVRRGLVVVEIATALVLAVSVGLLIRSFANVLNVSPGYDIENVFTASVWPTGPRYSGPDHFYPKLLDRLASVPGVEAVGATSQLPLANDAGAALKFSIGQMPDSLELTDPALFNSATADYLKAMGIRLVEGRNFRTSDMQQTSRPVAAVSLAFAKRYWPDNTAIGKHVGVLGTQWEVVGVVADVRPFSLEQTKGSAQVYLAFPQSALALGAMAIRSRLDSASLTLAVRQAVGSLDPDLPVYNILTMKDRLSETLARRRMTLVLLGAMAVMALLLGAVGIVAMTSGSVAMRTREIGIRMALGAQRRDVLQMIVFQSLEPILAGILLGLGCALALTHVLASLLFGVSSTDPVTFITFASFMAAIALAAAYVPARRAMRVDPLMALRHD